MEPKLFYFMDELAEIFGSRQRAYDLGNSGKLELKKLGKLSGATHDAVVKCLAELPPYIPGTQAPLTPPNPKKRAQVAA